MPELTFRTNSKLKTLVGQELITNNNIAIFELIKNSYDAGATEVHIQFHDFSPISKGWESSEKSMIKIIDNGIGMTVEEVDKYWMELGNSFKENEKLLRIDSEKMGKIITRFANGEKGIGRFGVDKIGEELILESIGQTKLNEKVIVYFDWNKYEDRSKLLQEIKNEYHIDMLDDNIESGLSLTIKKLRDSWNNANIEKLKKDISKFLSPIDNESDFIITMSFYIDGKEKESFQLKNDTFEHLKCKIEAELESDGIAEISIKIDDEIEHFERVRIFEKQSPFGRTFVEIYYLDKGEKISFTRRMGIRPSDYGNIKIFRDKFRIVPYGEPHNDWLEIDRHHAQGMFRTFGTRDLVGNVFINGEDLSRLDALKEATDRVGFIEDRPEFEILKDFLWNLISIFEDFIFNRIKKQALADYGFVKKETSDLKFDIDTKVKELKDTIDGLVIAPEDKKIFLDNIASTEVLLNDRIGKIEKASDEIESKIKIYSQLSNREGILFEMLHSIKNKLVVIQGQLVYYQMIIDEQNLDIDLSVLYTLYEDIAKLVEGALDRVNSTKLHKKNEILKDIIDRISEQYKSYLEQNGIRLDIVYPKEIDKVRVFCARESVLTVFDNLLSNSVKALDGVVGAKIQIMVKLSDRDIKIYFSDNGCGIPKDKYASVFSLWSSGTSGTGIGLASVKENLTDIKGTIHLVDIEEGDFSTSFLIKLPRR
ncbi:sensor histidine kinase [Streptococcus sanguinis]|jgi:histidine kinase|uniref:sensor histidine kinase n=1 Tax=Streptococcus sanguinis TaxID=1305 RepID=UPI000779BAA8|nr:sensor histidine kinase [Streptococcus sanguinis]